MIKILKLQEAFFGTSMSESDTGRRRKIFLFLLNTANFSKRCLVILRPLDQIRNPFQETSFRSFVSRETDKGFDAC